MRDKAWLLYFTPAIFSQTFLKGVARRRVRYVSVVPESTMTWPKLRTCSSISTMTNFSPFLDLGRVATAFANVYLLQFDVVEAAAAVQGASVDHRR